MAKKSKRVKPDNPLLTIPDWAHADYLLRTMGNHQLKVQEAEAAAKDAIDAANATMAAAVKHHQQKIAHITRSLEAFAIHYRNDFGDKKSKDLTFGTLGWRLSKSISVSTKHTLELIKQVFKRRAKQYIHVTEKPDKEALAKLKDGKLATVKARRIVKDDFFVEPKLPEAVDYPESQ